MKLQPGISTHFLFYIPLSEKKAGSYPPEALRGLTEGKIYSIIKWAGNLFQSVNDDGKVFTWKAFDFMQDAKYSINLEKILE